MNVSRLYVLERYSRQAKLWIMWIFYSKYCLRKILIFSFRSQSDSAVCLGSHFHPVNNWFVTWNKRILQRIPKHRPDWEITVLCGACARDRTRCLVLLCICLDGIIDFVPFNMMLVVTRNVGTCTELLWRSSSSIQFKLNFSIISCKVVINMNTWIVRATAAKFSPADQRSQIIHYCLFN